MACEHKRIKSVNCVIFCMDCGAKLDKAPVYKTERGEPAEKPRRRTKKKGAEVK